MSDLNSRSTMPTPRRTPSARQQILLVALGASSLVMTLLQEYFLRHQTSLGLGLIAVFVLFAVFAVFTSRKTSTTASNLIPVVALAAGVAEILWFIAQWNWLWVSAHIGAVVLALWAWITVWRHRSRNPVHGSRRLQRIGLRAVGAVLSLVVAVVAGFMILTDITVKPGIYMLQAAAHQQNSFEPEARSSETLVAGNTMLVNDIAYGTQYPNSYLDIYYKDADRTVTRPTYIFIHGGGWIAGSKSQGDPNAASTDYALGNGPMIDTGYNVVSLGYALAPGAPFPTQVTQVSQAVEFLSTHAQEYGLDMTRVVIGGSSAGGQLAGQFVNIETNPAYATEIGIAPVLRRDALRAVVLDSAALDMSRVGRTEVPVTTSDWAFSLSLRGYVGQPQASTRENAAAQQADVTAHVTANFPPAFIADGNDGTFPDQARDLGKKLTDLGVTNRLDLPPISNGALGHGYMAASSSATETYNTNKLAFLAPLTHN